MKKAISIFFAVMVLLSLLTACTKKEGSKPAATTTSSAVSNKKKSITIGKYLSSGPTIGLVTSTYPLDKSSVPEMYLFEDGKVYYVYSVGDDGFLTQDAVLTLGQIAKMTDEELVEHARRYKSLYSKPMIEYIVDPDYAFVDVFDNNLYEEHTIGIYPPNNQKGKCFDCSENGDIYFRMTFYIQYSDTMAGGVEYEMKRNKDGNIFFLKDHQYYVVEGINQMVYNENGTYKYDTFNEDTLYDGRYGEIPFPEGHFKITHENIMTTGEYALHIYTDISGNTLEKESIEVEAQIESNGNTRTDILELFNMINIKKEMGIVYDSQFSVFCKRDMGPYLLFRTNDYSVVLDGINDDGILLD